MSTPLRAGCFNGHLEIVEHLTEHGANFNVTDIDNIICLMVAAFKSMYISVYL